MKIVIFGLSISSAWGNGHATLWRGLCRGLIKRGHYPVFFEHDVPYYAQHRDLMEIDGGELILYPAWDAVIETAEEHLEDADVAMVTSFCPDGIAATQIILEAGAPLRDVSPEYPMEYLHEPFHYSLRPGQGIVLVTQRD